MGEDVKSYGILYPNLFDLYNPSELAKDCAVYSLQSIWVNDYMLNLEAGIY